MGAFEVQLPPAICEPAPLSQGYWHRQCLGAGRISPGRNGQGRGPQEPNDPMFFNIEPAVDLALMNAIGEPRACADGIDAEPPSDKCEKAKKQYTALLFNLTSGRLSGSCEVELACGVSDLTTMLDTLAGLINSQDQEMCNQAASCAAALNGGHIGGGS
jgi:hypothetical protein